jgi:hypothetical protein
MLAEPIYIPAPLPLVIPAPTMLFEKDFRNLPESIIIIYYEDILFKTFIINEYLYL